MALTASVFQRPPAAGDTPEAIKENDKLLRVKDTKLMELVYASIFDILPSTVIVQYDVLKGPRTLTLEQFRAVGTLPLATLSLTLFLLCSFCFIRF